jgi:Protein of unknown function (DUF3455)
MKSFEPLVDQTIRRRRLLIACAAALGLTFTASQSQMAFADIVVPPGHKVYLEGRAVGTQNYICLPCPNPILAAGTPCPPGSGFIWTLFGPQATLFDVDDGDDDQIITHFLSTNPSDGKARPTWQHSRDTSAVWGNAIASSPSPVSGSIPLLLLQVVGSESGPTGGDKLTAATYIHRLNTAGGVAPAATTCDEATEVGSRELVPYTADYFFYKPRK